MVSLAATALPLADQAMALAVDTDPADLLAADTELELVELPLLPNRRPTKPRLLRTPKPVLPLKLPSKPLLSSQLKPPRPLNKPRLL